MRKKHLIRLSSGTAAHVVADTLLIGDTVTTAYVEDSDGMRQYIEPGKVEAVLASFPLSRRELLIELQSGLGLSDRQLVCLLRVNDDEVKHWTTGKYKPHQHTLALLDLCSFLCRRYPMTWQAFLAFRHPGLHRRLGGGSAKDGYTLASGR